MMCVVLSFLQGREVETKRLRSLAIHPSCELACGSSVQVCILSLETPAKVSSLHSKENWREREKLAWMLRRTRLIFFPLQTFLSFAVVLHFDTKNKSLKPGRFAMERGTFLPSFSFSPRCARFVLLFQVYVRTMLSDRKSRRSNAANPSLSRGGWDRPKDEQASSVVSVLFFTAAEIRVFLFSLAWRVH